jgi:MerR family transcriptional regulator, light-induced transcriptional regulator
VRVVRELIEQVRAAELPRQVKILVGGYPFKLANDLWKKIGADSCASDAEAAVEAANKLFATTT